MTTSAMTTEEFINLSSEIDEKEKAIYERRFKELLPKFELICALKGLPSSEENFKKILFGPNYKDLGYDFLK